MLVVFSLSRGLQRPFQLEIYFILVLMHIQDMHVNVKWVYHDIINIIKVINVAHVCRRVRLGIVWLG